MTSKNQESLDTREQAKFYAGECPDCGERQLLQGPSGGGCINVYCGNGVTCGSRFNDTGVFGIDRICDASPNRPKPWTRPVENAPPREDARPTAWERLVKEEE